MAHHEKHSSQKHLIHDHEGSNCKAACQQSIAHLGEHSGRSKYPANIGAVTSFPTAIAGHSHLDCSSSAVCIESAGLSFAELCQAADAQDSAVEAVAEAGTPLLPTLEYVAEHTLNKHTWAYPVVSG